MATATENNDNSKDDDPGAVIVEKIAKTVVIHSMFLRSMFAILHRSFTYYARPYLRDTLWKTKIKGTVTGHQIMAFLPFLFYSMI